MKSFFSDYVSPPHPDVIRAVAEACARPCDGPYGKDSITGSAVEILRRHFGPGVVVLFVSNGTAANRLALQTLLRYPFESVICAERAHINTYECGALESLGHKLLPVAATNGKIGLSAVGRYLDHGQPADVHLTCPRVLSLSNATEIGTVYSLEELRLIGDYVLDRGLLVHVDGARLAYAAAHLCPSRLQHITFDVCADVITLGGTKLGGMLGEAVIFRDPDLGDVAARIHKQQGQLCARQHVIAAQFKALFLDGLWRRLATNANAMATLLAGRCRDKLGLKLAYPVESNAVFVKLPAATIRLLELETECLIWSPPEGIVRWMCSWDTTEEDVDDLIRLIEKDMD